VEVRRNTEVEAALVAKYAGIAGVLNEKVRRLWAATESRAIGYGGDALVSAATGLARETIRKGRIELEAGFDQGDRIRERGAGRPFLTKTQPGLADALERLVEPLTRGDPMSPLRWTCKSKAKLAATLTRQGWVVSATSVGRLLHDLGFSLQVVRKTREGRSHPDRNEQFELINAMATKFLRLRKPVISVDTKKKELVGDFRNGGKEWQPKDEPERVLVHDFPDTATGKAIPYGVYDMARNEAYVSVGLDHDTPAFAVAAIRRWWLTMGRLAYPTARQLYITADAGGSNGYRARAWKVELQKFSDEFRLAVVVSHFPPGTSKWNKIEHRLFCHITVNWRGKPLRTFETVVQLIGNTRTATGLRVKAKLDKRAYPTGVKVTPAEMKELSLRQGDFHGEWNYEIRPRT
jgi:transposase